MILTLAFIATSNGVEVYLPNVFALFILLFGAMVGAVFVPGFEKIPEVNHGLISILGTRQRRILWWKFPVYGEGYYWVFPIIAIMSVEPVDMRIKVLDIPGLKPDGTPHDPFRVWTLGHKKPKTSRKLKAGAAPVADNTKTDVTTEGRVEMLVRIGIRHQVFCSYVSQELGKEQLLDAIRQIAIGSCRDIAALRTDLDFVQDKSKIETKIEQSMDLHSRNEWGVDIKKVVIPTALPANQRVKDAYERVTVEHREQKAEQVKFAHTRTETGKMAEVYEGLGLTRAVAAQEAIVTLRAEQGQATQTHITGTASDLVAAASLIQNNPKGNITND
jgi:hypothetical protein